MIGKDKPPKSKTSAKAPIYSIDVQSYNKEIKGFKILKADKPQKETTPFVKGRYPTLSTE
jgi:hypothetical protein